VSTRGQILADYLDALGVPEALRRAVDCGPAFPTGLRLWPPKPGCCESPDLAIVRMWAGIDLAEWIEHASNAFGPHRTGELDALAAVGARLRTGGEGAQVLWAIDVVAAEQWVKHPSPGLAVVEMVCFGPRLADRLVNETDAELTRIGWCYNSEQANRPCIVNHTPCFESSWHEANTRPSLAGPIANLRASGVR
jgi:hypothetical protein